MDECNFTAKHRATVINHFKGSSHPPSGAARRSYHDREDNNSSDDDDQTNQNDDSSILSSVELVKYKVGALKCLEEKCDCYFISGQELNFHLSAIHLINSNKCALVECGKSFRFK